MAAPFAAALTRQGSGSEPPPPTECRPVPPGDRQGHAIQLCELLDRLTWPRLPVSKDGRLSTEPSGIAPAGRSIRGCLREEEEEPHSLLGLPAPLPHETCSAFRHTAGHIGTIPTRVRSPRTLIGPPAISAPRIGWAVFRIGNVAGSVRRRSLRKGGRGPAGNASFFP